MAGGKIRHNYLILLATPAGFEPATYCLEGSCSIRLSYGVETTSFVNASTGRCGWS
jgi:hypothetical protein